MMPTCKFDLFGISQTKNTYNIPTQGSKGLLKKKNVAKRKV